MDPDLIFSRYRDDAFASQLTANEYSTFVAMPFRDRFSYRASQVYSEVIQAAGGRANELLDKDPGPCLSRRFATPRRVDDRPMTATDIGGEIAKAILYAHVVVADLTFANDGVLLEVGAALALKPTNQIVLITQGRPDELHFDIKGNAVIPYSQDCAVDKISTAMIAAAQHFEERRAEYITNVSQYLSHDAIWLMNWYGRLRNGRMVLHGRPKTPIQTWLNAAIGMEAFLAHSGFGEPSDDREGAMIRYQLAVRDLLAKRLLSSDYRPRSPEPGTDSFGVRGTPLGWAFIRHRWDDLECPEGEFNRDAP